jgi:hypothetical protein
MIYIKVEQHHEKISFYYNCLKLHSCFDNYASTMKLDWNTTESFTLTPVMETITFEKAQFHSTKKAMYMFAAYLLKEMC